MNSALAPRRRALSQGDEPVALSGSVTIDTGAGLASALRARRPATWSPPTQASKPGCLAAPWVPRCRASMFLSASTPAAG